jgi:hypothetical protein
MLDARCEPYLQSLVSKEKHTSQKKKKTKNEKQQQNVKS